MTRARLSLAVLALAFAASRAEAQGSVFGLRGLGWLGRPVSGRAAGTGGAMSMFDAEMADNPAALSRWRSVAGWAVGAPTRRTFTGPSGSTILETVRFPLLGFAAVVPTRTTVSVSIGDFLDRTWTIIRTDSANLRGVMEKFQEAGRSVGGVSDLSLGAAYRLTPSWAIGAGFHYYLGSARLTQQRQYDTLSTGQPSPYDEIIIQSITDYSGVGLSVGVLGAVRRFDISISARVNGPLKSSNTTGEVARTGLPLMLGFGLRYAPVPGVFVAGSAQFAGWHSADASLVSAGHDTARNTWSLGLGAEALNTSVFGLHTPLRIGWRFRQLPFLSLGQGINESAFSGGFSLSLAADRTTIDISGERGSRSTSLEKETFSSLFVGLTVRP